ncbi:MAG: helix-hairpin-helix domain-containing protein [Campylobacter sp.]|nr:helix-hairpin-helix domain-containing protein [Campylobacter sp.]
MKRIAILAILANFAFATINLNTASSKELMSLGFSKNEALSIIKYRKAHKFKNTDELFKVRGLSSDKVQKVIDEVNTGENVKKPKKNTKNAKVKK